MITRRTLLLLPGSALAWAAVRRSSGSAKVARAIDRLEGERSLINSPIQVPRDFLGMHAHRWPGDANASPAPAYSFGASRSHDHDGLFWSDLHAGPDKYRWDRMDQWVQTHSGAGRTLVYTLYGTPAWLTTEAGRRDLYGRSGGAAPPSNLVPLRAFVQSMLARYNGDGRQRLGWIETWNEPHFEGASRDFWWGSAEQLVGVGRTIYLAVKDGAFATRVLSPGFVADAESDASATLVAHTPQRHRSMLQYLAASDGQGGRGASWCDGIAFHTYNVALSGPHIAGLDEVGEIQRSLKDLNVSLPIFNTECGFVAPHPFRELSPARQAGFLKRLGVLQAAHGVQGLFFYSHDDDFVGNPSVHTEIAEALDALNKRIAGASLRQVTLGSDGAVHVTTDAGDFVW